MKRLPPCLVTTFTTFLVRCRLGGRPTDDVDFLEKSIPIRSRDAVLADVKSYRR